MRSPPRTAIPTRAIIASTAISVNYMRNSVKVVIDAYDGTTTFYVFRFNETRSSRHIATFFLACSRMRPRCRQVCANTCAIRSCCSSCRRQVYGLYHMTDPEVFYNREDLWSVASEVAMAEGGEQKTQTMQPNFVLMKLPGETARGVCGDSAVHAREPQ